MKKYFFILYRLLFFSFICMVKVTSDHSRIAHPTDALTDFYLLKAASKWFLTNEMDLFYLSEKNLKKEFAKFIFDHKIAYKDSKSLRKAMTLVESVRKQRVVILMKLLASFRSINSKIKKIPFKYGKKK